MIILLDPTYISLYSLYIPLYVLLILLVYSPYYVFASACLPLLSLTFPCFCLLPSPSLAYACFLCFALKENKKEGKARSIEKNHCWSLLLLACRCFLLLASCFHLLFRASLAFLCLCLLSLPLFKGKGKTEHQRNARERKKDSTGKACSLLSRLQFRASEAV